MKKILIAAIASLILIPLLLSCGNSVADPCECGDQNQGYIDVYYSGGAKALDGAWQMKTITVPSRMVVDGTFRSLESTFDGMTIHGMEFRNIISIEGLFTQEEVVPPLVHLRFDENLESIGTKCFRWSRKLEEVFFNKSEIIPEVWIDAFPDAADYESDNGCAFHIPAEFKDEYKEQLGPFINMDNGYIVVDVEIKLDTNTSNYSSDPLFGTPALSSDTLSISTGDVVKGVPVPTLTGWTFIGYYADSSTTETQIFSTSGDLLENVPSYSNHNGVWMNEDAQTVVYAHWIKNRYEVSFVSSDEENGKVDTTLIGTVPFGSEIIVEDNVITLPTDVGDVSCTAIPTENTTKTIYEFDSWKGVPETITENVTITAVFTSYTNPGFEPVVKTDTLVDLDLGTEEHGSRHTYNGISVAYHATNIGVTLTPYGTYSSVIGYYAEPSFSTLVADSTGAFVLNVDGYTDEVGWACDESKAVLYVNWN